MGSVDVAPVESQVVLQGGFLREEGFLHGIDVAKVLEEVVGRTIDGQEVLLAVARHEEVEAVADAEGPCHLILGTDVEVNLRALGVVLVLAWSVLEYPVGIAESFIDTLTAKDKREV